MLDFLIISTRTTKSGIEVYPRFVINAKSQDLMIRGGDFYAVWVEERGLWSTDEQDALRLIDLELENYAREHRDEIGPNSRLMYMWDADTGMIDKWHRYCQKQMRDNYQMLDEKLIFSNTETNKKDYASKRLSYPLEPGNITGYEKLMSTLYSEEERHKIEWSIGAIVTGDSKELQKFMVLYGPAGTGKSTVLTIIQQLFDGYYSVFDAKALGSSNNAFALEAFKTNPLVAIQHDGDLSKIEDNTRLNSLVSHEYMTINEKFKSTYTNRFKCFLFMGTNRPVKITDAKSGLLRRLIDVTPSGKKLGVREYKNAVKQVSFELGAIAHHCKEVYLEDPGAYDDYIPITMLGASNDFYNYVLDMYHTFKTEDGTTLKSAWEAYKTYCDEAKISYSFSQRNFKEELKNYFWTFEERFTSEDGARVRSYYSGFKFDKFESEFKRTKKSDIEKDEAKIKLIQFKEQESIFDKERADCIAQYATSKETPTKKWEFVDTKLADLDTSQLHYVKVPENHIVVDFDIKDSEGNKSLEKNIEEASKWPATYAELSKSGNGVHLHYIYQGDASKLSRIYDDNIEIKVFTGKSSLRRRLTKCNNLPIVNISSGLPLRGDDRVVNFEGIKNEKMLRTMIKKNLRKEYHADTRSSIDYINHLLDQAYDSGIGYDVSDLKNAVIAFAANSTNQADYCIKLVNKMKFKSEEIGENVESANEPPIAFYDVEVFPNLFLVNYKLAGEDKPVVRMINPKPAEIENLLRYRLIGYNNRRYDNHMIYARYIGYSTEQIYDLSQKIINSDKGAANKYLFGEAYNLSYTDIYDFASAGNKKSLKKLEIEMGIHHQELGLPWDKPVPEDKWIEVAEYCDNDVIATEAAFHYLKGDWVARQILADLSGMTVNDTTNSLSQRIIFGKNRKPQNEFNYRFLADPVGSDQYEEYRRKFGEDYKFRVWGADGLPQYRDYIPGEKLPDGWSILPFFPGYTFEFGKSTYLGEEIGEGGRVYSEPGMYVTVWDADVTGQHPSSAIAEVAFGPKYTKAFKEIVDARVSIKHQAWDDINELFDGKLKPYIQKVIDGELTTKELANALKTVVNAVYGQTAAKYDNPFRDIRNKDNLVAKRGALFMTLLTSEVQKRGYVVAHNKTDSIKIANATPEIREFVINFGREYGYEFETEAEFSKFCLVNKAVYIAKLAEPEIDKATGKEVWWTATGDQFAVPYVFKTLFTHDELVFDDLCETFEVKKGALYLDMNESLPDVSEFEVVKEIRESVAAGKDLQKSKFTKKDILLYERFEQMSDEELSKKIAEGHDYRFIGRIGRFCPIKPGLGGGSLFRVDNDKPYAASGSTGYRWLESEMIQNCNEDAIDKSFYKKLVDDAVDAIRQYGDFEWFVSDDPVPTQVDETKLEHPVGAELPWLVACGKETCTGCPKLHWDKFHFDCEDGHDISDFAAAQFFQEDDELFRKR